LDGAGVEKGEGYSNVFAIFDGVEVRVVRPALEEVVNVIFDVLSVVGCWEKVGFLLRGRVAESVGARLGLADASFKVVVPANVSC
jgi:hypothetical protein